MVREAGAEYVIIGHSERRALFGETDDTVNRRTRAALAAGLVPIVCVGETLEQRDAGQTLAVVDQQLQRGLDGVTADQVAAMVVAYEPVWAIGTGRNATPEQAGEVHAHLRMRLRSWWGAGAAEQCHVIYGGSVKPGNIAGAAGRARRGRRAGRRRQPGCGGIRQIVAGAVRPAATKACPERASRLALGQAKAVYSEFAAPPGARQSDLMLYYLFVTLYVVACLVLMIVILLQQGKGGDIANAFGGGASQAVFGARAGATVLTKMTTGLTVAFMVLALLLAVWGSRGTSSVVGGVDGPPAAACRPRPRRQCSGTRSTTGPAPAARPRRPRASQRPLPPRRPTPAPASRRRRRSSRHVPTRGSCRRRAQLNSETASVAVFSPLNAEVAELADAPA